MLKCRGIWSEIIFIKNYENRPFYNRYLTTSATACKAYITHLLHLLHLHSTQPAAKKIDKNKKKTEERGAKERNRFKFFLHCPVRSADMQATGAHRLSLIPGLALGGILGGALITNVVTRLVNARPDRNSLFIRRRPRRPCPRCAGFGITRCTLCDGEAIVVSFKTVLSFFSRIHPSSL